jgi:exonuclease VII small subunit|tara:strand:+ start:262 stop:495 length:234 start_codon:yes stop_codon:yes gene_type:complete
MKSKNIPADIKSKSIKEAKEEIDAILSKLEKNDDGFESFSGDYQRLIKLNNHVDFLFKNRAKEISSASKGKTAKKND